MPFAPQVLDQAADSLCVVKFNAERLVIRIMGSDDHKGKAFGLQLCNNMPLH